MKTILLILAMSVFLIADSIKTDLVVTFHNLTLEQAAELEKRINEEFEDYSKTISIPETPEGNHPYWWGGVQLIDDNFNIEE